MASSLEYKKLESSFSTSVTGKELKFDPNNSSFSGTVSLLYTLAFTIIIVIATTKYLIAAGWRLFPGENGIKKSDALFKRVTLGLLGVFSMFLVIAALNKDILLGDVGLSQLRVRGGGGGSSLNQSKAPTTSTPSTGVFSGSSGSKTCASPEEIKTSLATDGGICANYSCKVLTGCRYQDYMSIIQQESQAQGVDYKMVIVTMCKESGGRVDAQNRNPNGTYDCGLMQVNQQTPCDSSSLSPAQNIAKGVQTLKGAMSTANRVYPNIPAVANVFASYNCCANGTRPSEASIDCTISSGFPSAIPKWACPINPGTGDYNMCTVKAYACELVSCLNNL
jgi:hypothetical protein